MELLAPAGDMEKLKTALHFGADAVYFAGKSFGLRAFAGNFENISEPIDYCHKLGKKAYVTVNIYARNDDFDGLCDYLSKLQTAGADGIIVSDIGIMDLASKVAPKLELHVSTQANTTNKYAALSYAEKYNAKRIVLARELPLSDIKQIVDALKGKAEVETFVHGAMCISYSGRCLLSNYLCGRESNRGACVQACRWGYSLKPENRDQKFGIEEDERGTYILNSKDMCMIEHLDKMEAAGIFSLKIEGRMKSPYYVATVTNAYRKALNILEKCKKENKPYVVPKELYEELLKTSHRQYTTGYMVDNGDLKQNYESAAQEQTSDFIAVVKEVTDGGFWLEQRNRFMSGDKLELLSPSECHGKIIIVPTMTNAKGESVVDAKNVQELLFVPLKVKGLSAGDIIRSVTSK